MSPHGSSSQMESVVRVPAFKEAAAVSARGAGVLKSGTLALLFLSQLLLPVREDGSHKCSWADNTTSSTAAMAGFGSPIASLEHGQCSQI